MGQVAEAMLGTADALLAGLDPEQREVALATRGPVCVLAGAGTGKTRAITYRIAYAAAVGVANPAHVLALTFTVRAAGELRGRLRQLGAAGSGFGGASFEGLGTSLVRASTFHAAALRQLNYFWPRVIGGRPPKLIDSKAGLVREAAKQAQVRLDRAGLSDAAAEIEWAKVTQVRPDGYRQAAAAAGRSPVPGADHLAAVYQAYEQLRRERHLIDFESVLELTAAILAENRLAADQVRDTFRYFVVDEYQDVNPLQKLLLDAWLGDRDELCVVGDPHQVIYSFTGATPSYLTGFAAEFPGAAVVRLVRDYRSTPQVVAVANQLVRSGVALIAQRPSGPRPVLTQYADDADEAAGLAIQIQALRAAGVPAKEIAVLVRINADTERFERTLADAGVPSWCAGPSVSTSGPSCARRWCCCAAPRGATRRRPRAGGCSPAAPGPVIRCPPRSGTCSPASDWLPGRPAAARRPGSAGSRSPRSPSSPTTCTPRGRRRR